MKTADFSPAPSPSLDQQRDALCKGLGRAVIWAEQGHLDESLLLEACLHDWRFELSVEEYRGDWLWQIVRAAQAEGRFRTAIFNGLVQLSENDAVQLCQLGYYYAARDDEAFRARLYKIVEDKPFADMRYLGEKEIIRLDGERAFLFAVRLRGRQLEEREWEWDDSVLVDESSEQLGEERLGLLLDTESDMDARRFREAWINSKSKSTSSDNPRSVYENQIRQIPLTDIITAAESPTTKVAYFRSWGRRASENDLKTVFERLLSSSDPRIISNYLKVFSGTEFPRIVPEIVSLSQHSDPEVRKRAISALENSRHPLVRELAEHELKNGIPGGLALGLFVKNYHDGDEHKIFQFVQLPEDAEEQHWLLKDATKILEENPNADCSRLAVATYALIPCSFCRYFAARLLRDRHAAPRWLIDECRFDSEPDTQKLFLAP